MLKVVLTSSVMVMLLAACGSGSSNPATGSSSDSPPPSNPVAPPTTPPTTPPATPVDHAPTISGTAAATATVGTAYSFTPTAADSDGDTLVFSASNKPAWAALDTRTGRLSGTPAAAGTFANIIVTVSDGTMAAALPAFQIVVTAPATTPPPTTPPPTTPPPTTPPVTNKAPTISGSPTLALQVGALWSFTPTAADADGNKLTFSITGKPAWATFDAATGKLSGTPTAAGTFTGVTISVSDGTASASLTAFTLVAVAAPLPDGAPQVLYTDLTYGPTSGGENNNGVYLSIFGKNFGSTGLGSTVKVTIGGADVANYRYLGPSKGLPNVQQITVQVGSLGGAAAGSALPIVVSVSGVKSNPDKTFTVQPGDILFVDNVSGSDSTAMKNDITKPWRYVQTSGDGGALGSATIRPGDVIVMRGKAPWSDVGFEQRFLRFRYVTGKQPTGAKGTGYITIMGYPGEDVDIKPHANSSGGIHGIGDSYPEMSDWVVIAGLHIEGGDRTVNDGPINLQANSDHWRIVNNEVGPWAAEDGSQGAEARAGGIAGNGTDVTIYGNQIHDIDGGTLNHCIYLDTGATQVDIGYNSIHHCLGGNMIQTFDNLGMEDLKQISIHHNVLHDGNRYGLNIADSTQSLNAWNNVIYNVAYAAVRFNVTGSSTSINVAYNTIYNANTTSGADNAPVINSWTLSSGTARFQHNIVVKGPKSTSSDYFINSGSGAAKLEKNLWFGMNIGVPTEDAAAVGGKSDALDPLFVNAAAGDFHLKDGSPAIDAGTATVAIAVTDDLDFSARPKGAKPDIGAYELK